MVPRHCYCYLVIYEAWRNDEVGNVVKSSFGLEATRWGQYWWGIREFHYTILLF